MTETTGEKVVRIGNVIGKLEQSTLPLTVDFKSDGDNDPAEKQKIDDDNLIPNPGDFRIMRQHGNIISPDGEMVIPTELTFIRTREKNGGVSVVCQIPALALEPGLT